MNSTNSRRLLAAAALLALGGCMKDPSAAANKTANQTTRATVDNSDPTASAQSAAPASVSANAAIVKVAADGAMTELRKGTNGWTCMPDAPATPGPDPMCFDASAGNWVDAWLHHKPPPQGAVGLMYMLEGGTDASNTDPYATKPTADNDWVKTGPHIMIVGSKEILADRPSGGKPDTTVPYVMWAGTPYAHLMVPIGSAQ